MVAFKKLPTTAVDPFAWAIYHVSQLIDIATNGQLTVAVLDTSHLEHPLGSGCSDDTGTSGCEMRSA